MKSRTGLEPMQSCKGAARPFPGVSEGTRRSMSSNRSKDTKLELAFRKALWASGLRGYRKNVRRLPGCPDVVFGRHRLAVFINGCYWHGCESCGRFRWPKRNAGFWQSKIERNRMRDAEAIKNLESLGYTAITVWECEIKRSLQGCLERVRMAVSQS